jgi:hypothetical protein
MTAWFTTTQGDDLDDTLERVAHQAIMEFCECHLPVLGDTTIALLPIWNEGNAVWSEHVAVVDDPELPTHHAGWALMTRYSQHVSSLLQEVTTMDAHLRLRLEEYAVQVKAKNRTVKDIQKGNRELFQKNAWLETRVKKLNDKLMRTYHSRELCREPFFSGAVALLNSVDDYMKGCYMWTMCDTYGPRPYTDWAWKVCDVLVEFSPAWCTSIQIIVTLEYE